MANDNNRTPSYGLRRLSSIFYIAFLSMSFSAHALNSTPKNPKTFLQTLPRELFLQHLKKIAPKALTNEQKRTEFLKGYHGVQQSRIQKDVLEELIALKDENLIPYINPTLPDHLVHLEGDETENEETFTVPEGLTLFNDFGETPESVMFDKSKPTVIHVHGWSQDGTSEYFFYPERWQNFNRFIFRWHRDSLDPGDWGFIPNNAEDRLWAAEDPTIEISIGDEALRTTSGLAGEKLIRAYKKLLTLVGEDYDEDIRIVGNSLGNQMAVYLAYSIAVENTYYDGTYPVPDRLEMLDTYIGGPFGDRNIPDHSPLIRPPNFDTENSDRSIIKNMQEMLTFISDQFNIAIISYSSITSYWFAYDLWKVSNFQEMSGAWLGRTNFTDRHLKMKPMFYASISEERRPRLKQNADAPVPHFDVGPYAFSAKTPTEDIPEASEFVKTLQSSNTEDYEDFVSEGNPAYGIKTFEIKDDVFYHVERDF